MHSIFGVLKQEEEKKRKKKEKYICIYICREAQIN